jgi:hypothetical protein
MASGDKTSAAKAAASVPAAGGSDQKVADVEKETGSTTRSAKSARSSWSKGHRGAPKAEPAALQPSPGGSELHAEEVLDELGPPKAGRGGSSKEPSKRGAQVTLRGRFAPGAVVQLVKVDGAHVLRTTPGDEVVGERKVGKDGAVQFKDGVDKDARYFVRGYTPNGPLEVRVRGRAEADDSEVLAQDPVGYDEVRTRDGRVYGERGQRIPDVPEHLAH